MQTTSLEDADDDEAQIQKLLGAAGLQQQQQQQQQQPLPDSSLDGRGGISARRDVLVLDAACGSGSWQENVLSSEVDFTEQLGDGWTASVSVVLSLSASAQQMHMHDETGSGRAERMSSEAAALTAAQDRAIECARRRLAKRFATSLSRQVMWEIERQVNPNRPTAKRKWRGT